MTTENNRKKIKYYLIKEFKYYYYQVHGMGENVNLVWMERDHLEPGVTHSIVTISMSRPGVNSVNRVIKW